MAQQLAFNMDCMEAMRQMPDNAFDLAIVDPPYGINVCSQTVNVEREREREPRQGSVVERRSEVKTQIGVGLLSRPKSTTPLTIRSRQMPNTFRS